MDPISMSAPSYQDMMVHQSRVAQGEALLKLFDVADQAAMAHTTPMGGLSDTGTYIDTYA